MKEAPGFNALSYAWGDKDQTTSILLNGLGFKVTNNLHAALKVLRSKTNNSFLWVDAICVNQKDDYERSHQVSLMTRIYSKARIVLCWLGPDVDDHSILPFLRGCAHHADTLSSPQAFASKSGAIRDILSRPYWSRLWVVQENVLAKERLFLCGSNEISSEDLARSLRLLKYFVQLMASEFHGREVLQAASDIQDFHGTRMVDGTLMPSRQPQSHTIAEQFTLLNEMMIETSRFNTTDPRDYLYGVLGLFPDTTAIITPDYTKSPAEVFKDFALLTLKKNFGLIAESGTGHKNCTRMRRSCKEVPSWIPNHSGPFVEIHNGVSLLTSVRIAKFEAGTFFPHGWDLSQDNMALRVKGVRVGRVISRSSADTSVAKRLVNWNCCAATHITKHPRDSWRWAFYRTILMDRDRTFDFMGEQISVLQSICVEKAYLLLMQLAFGSFSSQPQPKVSHSHSARFAPSFETEKAYWRQENQTSQLRDLHQERSSQPTLDFACAEEIMAAECMLHCSKLTFAGEVDRITRDRCFVIIDTGYMGLAPIGAQIGDHVVLIGGCPVPLALRKQGEAYQVVGDTYVYGLMEGQMSDNVSTGTAHIEEFRLV